jgi:uncharacterized protein (TIGR02646 family)
MIKLRKLEEPELLKANKDLWTKEYLQAKTTGNMTNAINYRYRHPEIKARIREETSDKCAYCESKVTHTYPGDIEHILPRSIFPELAVEWENLTLSCGECNRRKSDYHSSEEPLVNPYRDNPEEHLFVAGAFIFGKVADGKGALTELKLELNRAELIERRYERIKSLKNLAERYANQAAGTLKDLLRKELLKEIERDKEYAFISRAFLKLCCDISYNSN